MVQNLFGCIDLKVSWQELETNRIGQHIIYFEARYEKP